MPATTFEVHIPAELLGYGFQPDDVQNQVIEWLVLSLFKDGHISSGKAARLLSLTRIEFLALLRRRGIAYIDFSSTELAEELAAVKSLVVEARP
jgi:predicted HTH domain antitoxin